MKLFVWDFHGVLEEGNIAALVEFANLTLASFGIDRKISNIEATKWYGQSWYDYFKNAYPAGNDKLFRAMVKKVLAIQNRHWEVVQKTIKPREHAMDVFSTIGRKKHQNVLLSNTHPKRIRKFTDELKMTDCFERILGINIHNRSRTQLKLEEIKAEVLKRYLKNKQFEAVVAIGDKEHDVLAGKLCGATTYLFLAPELYTKPLKSSETAADFIISDLRKVLKEI